MMHWNGWYFVTVLVFVSDPCQAVSVAEHEMSVKTLVIRRCV